MTQTMYAHVNKRKKEKENRGNVQKVTVNVGFGRSRTEL
jgi:hypothetical protein